MWVQVPKDLAIFWCFFRHVGREVTVYVELPRLELADRGGGLTSYAVVPTQLVHFDKGYEYG